MNRSALPKIIDLGRVVQMTMDMELSTELNHTADDWSRVTWGDNFDDWGTHLLMFIISIYVYLYFANFRKEVLAANEVLATVQNGSIKESEGEDYVPLTNAEKSHPLLKSLDENNNNNAWNENSAPNANDEIMSPKSGIGNRSVYSTTTVSNEKYTNKHLKEYWKSISTDGKDFVFFKDENRTKLINVTLTCAASLSGPITLTLIKPTLLPRSLFKRRKYDTLDLKVEALQDYEYTKSGKGEEKKTYFGIKISFPHAEEAPWDIKLYTRSKDIQSQNVRMLNYIGSEDGQREVKYVLKRSNSFQKLGT